MSSITVKKDIPEIVQFLRELRQNAVESGLFANLVSEQTMIAATVQEFGAVIKMTDQMRKWFWAQMAKYGLRKKAALFVCTSAVLPQKTLNCSWGQCRLQGLQEPQALRERKDRPGEC